MKLKTLPEPDLGVFTLFGRTGSHIMKSIFFLLLDIFPIHYPSLQLYCAMQENKDHDFIKRCQRRTAIPLDVALFLYLQGHLQKGISEQRKVTEK